MKMFKRFLPLLCAVTLIIGSSMTVFAKEDYTLPSNVDYDKYNYVIYHVTRSDSSFYYFVAYPKSSKAYYENGNFYWTGGGTSYFALNEKKPEFVSASKTNNSGVDYISSGSSIDKFIASSVDIYNIKVDGNTYTPSDTIFFQKPLEPIATLAVPVGQAVQSQVGKILPVAVGCLALLIGSIVLLPRLRSFL